MKDHIPKMGSTKIGEDSIIGLEPHLSPLLLLYLVVPPMDVLAL